MTTYIKFKHYERGVPNNNPSSLAKYRTCSHCGSKAHWTAQRADLLTLFVRFCEKHVLVAREINDRRKRS